MGFCKKGHGRLNDRSACPECAKAYQKQYRKISGYKSRKHVMERHRRERHRQRAVDFLGGVCKDCGNSDPRVLVFDHLSDKAANIAHLLGKAWDHIESELRKCELVCANCHLIRTNERIPKAKDTFIFSKAVPRARINWAQPITIDGVTRTMKEWAALSGIAIGTLSKRIRLGWSSERAVTEPLKDWNK